MRELTQSETSRLRVALSALDRAARNTAQVVGLGAVPIALVIAFAGRRSGDAFAFDFRQFWRGGRDVVHGDSPYPALDRVEATPNLEALTPEAIQEVFRFPYPAPVAVVLAPFGALAFEVAATIFVLLLVTAVALTLRVLAVYDWRCYGAAFASIATLGAIRLGTLTPLLVLGAAVAWRYRDRRSIAAPVVAAVVLSKLFLWPLLVWLVATRRAATAALSVGAAAAAALAGWAVIAFAGLRDYPALVAKLGESVEDDGYSLVALVAALELPSAAGRGAPLVAAIVGVAAVALVARREDGDRRAFVLAIAVAVLASPIVWLHYFALALVPVALARRRLAPLWLLPLAWWLTPFQETEGEAWRIVAGLVIFALAIGFALRSPPPAPEPAAGVSPA